MLTSNYDMHRPKTIKQNRLNNLNYTTFNTNAQQVDYPIKNNSLLHQTSPLQQTSVFALAGRPPPPRIRSFIVTLRAQYTSQDQSNSLSLH